MTAGASSSSSVSPLALSMPSNRPIQLQIERLTKHLINERHHDRKAIYDTFVILLKEEEEVHGADVTLLQYKQQIEINSQDNCRPLSNELEIIM